MYSQTRTQLSTEHNRKQSPIPGFVVLITAIHQTFTASSAALPRLDPANKTETSDAKQDLKL
ncbi:hypothetical protein A2U01_0089850, partial [Trifolium medium]|nr:hypothetical protein [Trifolium medium]